MSRWTLSIATNPAFALHLPLWAVAILGLFIGVVAGWIAAWLKQGRWRRLARELKAENSVLKSENARLEKESQPARDIVEQPKHFLDGP